jgi:hypothetical protein
MYVAQQPEGQLLQLLNDSFVDYQRIFSSPVAAHNTLFFYFFGRYNGHLHIRCANPATSRTGIIAPQESQQ